MYAGRGLNVGFLFAMIGSRRVHLSVGANRKERRHEKEGQMTRARSAQSACRAKSIKKSGPLTRGRFVILPSRQKQQSRRRRLSANAFALVAVLPGRQWGVEPAVGESPHLVSP